MSVKVKKYIGKLSSFVSIISLARERRGRFSVLTYKHVKSSIGIKRHKVHYTWAISVTAKPTFSISMLGVIRNREYEDQNEEHYSLKNRIFFFFQERGRLG